MKTSDVAAAVVILVSVACDRAYDSRAEGEDAVLDFGGDRVEIGFGAPFSIEVRTAARGAPPEIRWTQVAGRPLRDVRIEQHGFLFSARTSELDLGAASLPLGLIPLSPRTRGEALLEAEWTPSGKGPSRRHQVRVVAAARSRGLPNVPLGQRLYLGGAGWHVTGKPAGATASMENVEGVSALTPDRRGHWDVTDDRGRTLRLQAGRYDETALDCGRAGCHAELVTTSANTPMTWALARRLQTSVGSSEPIACALACHATGEPGTHDGGFWDVATELGVSLSLEGVHDVGDLPRPLRRLGGVGCLACHGPSALPEDDARWSILRTDVCAYCHDAPPRYGHVAAWQTTAMARADADGEARTKDPCIGCHTTWGFLAGLEPSDTRGSTGRDRSAMPEHARRPPDGAFAIGLACAACHAVHGAARPDEPPPPSLLRKVPLPEMFDQTPEASRTRSGACLRCHAPVPGAAVVQGSAAALWAGRGGVDPETGALVSGSAPHLSVAGGCVGCHDGGPDDVERGSSHAFRANRARCASCHPAPMSDPSSIQNDARLLWNRLRELEVVRGAPDSAGSRPVHATDALRGDAQSLLGRAAYDVSMVLADRAAAVHNPGYARTLLELAKRAIERDHRPQRANPSRRGERL